MFFDNFWGNPRIASASEQMLEQGRIAQTLLFSGPEGVGKATLARRIGQRLLPHPELIERDDLSLPENLETVAARERWPSEKRNEDPLVFASHPDFLTFAPDGPLRQITIQQTRLLKERALYLPHHGKHRVFLVDHVDRANEQSANSLLKILEEPPEHLLVIMTAENAYDLLPTIRSRAVPFHFAPLAADQMRAFVKARALDQPERRTALSAGSPGVASSLDLEAFDKRRTAMLMLLKAAAGVVPFGAWSAVSEGIGRSKADKLDYYLKVLYDLLRDLVILRETASTPTAAAAVAIKNEDIRRELQPLAARLEFSWIRKAVQKVDQIVELLRRNIQKTIALDALIVELRGSL